MEMRDGIISINFEGPSYPCDRFGVGAKLQLGCANNILINAVVPRSPSALIAVDGRIAPTITTGFLLLTTRFV